MFWAILILTLILSVGLIVMVLLQPSKGGGIGAAFGGLGGALGSTFGARRSLDMLQKGTTYGAVLLGALCLLANLFFMPNQNSRSNQPVTTGAEAPLVPGGPAPLINNESSAPATGEEGSPAGEEAAGESGGQESSGGEAAPAPEGE